MIDKLIKFTQQQPALFKTLVLVAAGALIVWSYAGVDKHHAHTWMEKMIPGFWSFFGFLSCIVLVFFVRWFGNSGVQTGEDYYDK